MESIVRGEPVDCAQDRLVEPSFVGAYSRITMGVLDWIITTIRWFHLLAAVAWVGGGMFWLMVLRPVLGRTGANGSTTRRSIGEAFRSLVNTGIGVLLITGIVLSATRLTDTAATAFYVAVLVVKIILALYMFYVVRFLRPQVYPDDEGIADGRLSRIKDRLTGTGALLIYGVIILGLSDILNAIFENALRS